MSPKKEVAALRACHSHTQLRCSSDQGKTHQRTAGRALGPFRSPLQAKDTCDLCLQHVSHTLALRVCSLQYCEIDETKHCGCHATAVHRLGIRHLGAAVRIDAVLALCRR